MAKIESVPPSQMDTWTGRVTCGNPDCGAVLTITPADLYRAVSHHSDWGGHADKPQPVHDIASTCPACGRQWFLRPRDLALVPASVQRQLGRRP